MELVERRWHLFCAVFAGNEHPTPPAWVVSTGFALLRGMYEGRPYHNLHHVMDCIQTLDTLGDRIDPETKHIVEMALWWHDCYYEIGVPPGQNEAGSAMVATMFMTQVWEGWSRLSKVVDSVRASILATTHQKRFSPESIEALISDIDLYGLSLPREQYIANSRHIRTEYATATSQQWAVGRTAFLTHMLNRGYIYQTDFFTDRTALAAENMQAELQWLSSRQG